MSEPLHPRVIEAGLRSFTCAYETYVEGPLALGQMVIVREGPATVLGIVADAASGPDDPTRPLQARGSAGESAADVMAANPEVRLLLRTRLTVVCCGHAEGELFRAALPPTPPPLLAIVEPASRAETASFASDGAFLVMLVASPLCDDSVLAAAIRNAARSFDLAGHEFTVRAGKELARLLRAEPSRLASILRGVSS